MRVTIIGAGAVGLAIAYELSACIDEVVVLEQGKSVVSDNQSARNSGVIHAGIYYPKNLMPRKAELCVEGNERLYAFCNQESIPHKRTGKIVVASKEYQVEYLEDVVRIAAENGVACEWMEAKDINKKEKNIVGIKGVYITSSGIIDPVGLVRALARNAENRGAMILTNSQVVRIDPAGYGFVIQTSQESFESDMVINAAGLQSASIAKMVNHNSRYAIEPVRGEAAIYESRAGSQVSMNVYPAPYGYWNDSGERAEVPFEEFLRLQREGRVTKTVGVHLTPTLDSGGRLADSITIGPLKTVGRGDADYGSGLRPLDDYVRYVKDFFPGIKDVNLRHHQAGIMATPQGSLDFIIEKDPIYPGMINLVGIESPGLTAALAIGTYVKKLVKC